MSWCDETAADRPPEHTAGDNLADRADADHRDRLPTAHGADGPRRRSRCRCPSSRASSCRPTALRYRLKNKLLGPPLHTEQLEDERLGKPTALAVFASDNLSSSAYATEEMLRVLIPVIGLGAFALVVPITIALLVVLFFLILSYRQTIKAYPTAGGAYMVTRDNFGLLPAQVAGVALLTDYVLTVSVSVAAGTAALASAFSRVRRRGSCRSRSRSSSSSRAATCAASASRGRSSRSRPTSSSSTWRC